MAPKKKKKKWPHQNSLKPMYVKVRMYVDSEPSKKSCDFFPDLSFIY